MMQMQQRTGVQKSFLFIGGSVVLLLVLFGSHGTEFVCNFVGFAYPAYATVKAVRREPGYDSIDWCVYWVLFSTFTLIEDTFDGFFVELFGYLYFVFKIVFLVWCFLPQTMGMKIVFEKFVSPFLNRYEHPMQRPQ